MVVQIVEIPLWVCIYIYFKTFMPRSKSPILAVPWYLISQVLLEIFIGLEYWFFFWFTNMKSNFFFKLKPWKMSSWMLLYIFQFNKQTHVFKTRILVADHMGDCCMIKLLFSYLFIFESIVCSILTFYYNNFFHFYLIWQNAMFIFSYANWSLI